MIKPILAVLASTILIAACDDSSNSPNTGSNSTNSSWNCPNADEPLIDTRDGKVYKTVRIGNQVWMAENLNYETNYSWTNDSLDKDGTIYGRYYEHGPAKTACPEGWHLPSRDEFRELIKAVSRDTLAAWNLKTTSGWLQDEDGHNVNGGDTYCFGAKAAGEMTEQYPNAYSIGEYARFWTKDTYKPTRYDPTYNITYNDPEEAFVLEIANDTNEVSITGHRTYYASNIRCLKGEPEPELYTQEPNSTCCSDNSGNQ